MRFLVYLFTLLLFSTAVAQNPVILQGSYVTNVFGPSNFIKNPNAQNNTSDVFTSGGVITRSLTTPLVATTEFNVTTNTSTNNIYWTTRTFDAGTKNQNCEARFTYRGFTTGTTTAQITNNNTTVIAELVLVPSASDPRTVSINFPCGDPSTSKELRLQQSVATLTGTNEIGGIYMGLATNMANVAQAEEVGSYTVPGTANCEWTANSTTGLVNFAADADCPTGTVTGAADTTAGKIPGVKFNNLKPGKYMFIAQHTGGRTGAVADIAFLKFTDGTNSSAGLHLFNSTTGDIQSPVTHVLTTEYTTVTSPTVQVQGAVNNGSNTVFIPNGFPIYGFKITAYRFPSSSELVVTPERQNVFGGVVYTSGGQVLFNGSAEPTSFTAFNNSVWNQPTMLKGKAAVATTGSGNDLGFSIPNLPVGNYRLSFNGYAQAEGGSSSSTTNCNFRLRETTLNQEVVKFSQSTSVSSASQSTKDFQIAGDGIFNNTSVGTRNFILEANKTVDTSPTNIGYCEVYANSSTTSYNTQMSILITPLDQPTNSALYVQGPVKAAETGAAISAGYLGNSTSVATASEITINATNQYLTGLTQTLSAGVWLLIAEGQNTIVPPATGMTAGQVGFTDIRIQNTTDSTTAASISSVARCEAISSTIVSGGSGGFTLTTVVNITGTKTFQVQGTYQNSIAGGTTQKLRSGRFYAILLN